MRLIIGVLALLCGFSGTLTSQEIRFQTDWKAQAEHGGFYQALALGFYHAEGLDVRIRQGGPQVDNPRLMAAGALDLAMASNSFQPFAMQAVGIDSFIVMAAFQKDPQVLMVHETVPAQSFADLKGRPIFVADSALYTFWPWLKARFGFEDTQIRKYNYSIAPWLVNEDTVLEGYLSSEPFLAREAGISPRVLLFSDNGYPGYAAMVMVRGAYARENPDTVKAFVRASIKGWQSFIFDDPSPANQLILKDNPEMTQSLLDYAHKTMRDQEMVGDRTQVGQMSRQRWDDFYRQMSDIGALQNSLLVEKSVRFDFLPGPE